MSPELAKQASTFAGLADENRLRMVACLLEGPRSISELTAGSNITRQAVTKHLRFMERAGLVHMERHGREARWSLELERMEMARRYLGEISREWDARIERLRAGVESR